MPPRLQRFAVCVPTEEAQDGSWHSFLLKGRDDLRQDGRIMQLLRMAPGNGCPERQLIQGTDDVGR